LWDAEEDLVDLRLQRRHLRVQFRLDTFDLRRPCLKFRAFRFQPRFLIAGRLLELPGELPDLFPDRVLLGGELLSLRVELSTFGFERNQPVDVDVDALLARRVLVLLRVLAQVFQVNHWTERFNRTRGRGKPAAEPLGSRSQTRAQRLCRGSSLRSHPRFPLARRENIIGLSRKTGSTLRGHHRRLACPRGSVVLLRRRLHGPKHVVSTGRFRPPLAGAP
jgi:hypothetical protein